jgi:hypothetical protein
MTEECRRYIERLLMDTTVQEQEEKTRTFAESQEELVQLFNKNGVLYRMCSL